MLPQHACNCRLCHRPRAGKSNMPIHDGSPPEWRWRCKLCACTCPGEFRQMIHESCPTNMCIVVCMLACKPPHLYQCPPAWPPAAVEDEEAGREVSVCVRDMFSKERECISAQVHTCTCTCLCHCFHTDAVIFCPLAAMVLYRKAGVTLAMPVLLLL